MDKTRFLMIGGFLGAGKTTTIARLARHYCDQGERVGIVTNDQAHGLVDTASLRAQGFDVGEIAGACFCCKFDELMAATAALGAEHQPSVILTEPVGSCTDLVATVLHPLQHLYGDRYTLGPLVVLCKPEHGRKILGRSTGHQGKMGGFSPQASYIFSKQLEEADVIVLNKIDRLTATEQTELLGLLEERFPKKRILAASGMTGVGHAELMQVLAENPASREHALEIDYPTYAAGEAALGWLNGAVHFSSEAKPWSLDALAEGLVTHISKALTLAEIEPGHVKVLASSGPATAVANWVATDAPVELSVASERRVSTADTLINVRVHGDPDRLARFVQQSITTVASEKGLEYQRGAWQTFRPGRPEPIHRYATPDG
ncbi:MAG: cobalamin biosynthesis protein P47K [Pirellulales bacterium]|nr:cobalamin biosynthesis protein P47K [Pirellulales bacterium]